MNHHFLFLLLSFCLFFSACSSSKKKNQKAQIQDQTANAQAIQSDQQITDQQLTDQQTPQQKMPLAPGSVQVTAEILNIEASPRGFHCNLKIISIDGYGSSTPPLPEGTLIVTSVKKELLEDAAQDGSEKAVSSDKLGPGMVKNLTL